MDDYILVLHERDNVGVALKKLSQGKTYTTIGEISRNIKACQLIEFGHKIAIKNIAKDEPVFKYGEIIGYAKQSLKIGEWLHHHNIAELYCMGESINENKPIKI